MKEIEAGSAKGKAGRWMVALLLLLIALGISFMALKRRAGPSPESIGHGSLAVINGETMTEERYQEEMRLSQAKLALRGKREETVDEPRLFNRMVGDILLLQGAREAEISVDEEAVDTEIEAILRRVNRSRSEMEELLAIHGLAWGVLEQSVRDYLTLGAFIDEVILEGVPAVDRQDTLQNWMRAIYREAEMEFDEAFLNKINSALPTAE